MDLFFRFSFEPLLKCKSLTVVCSLAEFPLFNRIWCSPSTFTCKVECEKYGTRPYNKTLYKVLFTAIADGVCKVFYMWKIGSSKE